MERLFLNPPIYQAYQERLGDVRVLLMRACQSLLYIEEECASRGLDLDTLAIDERRMANRPPSHPYWMIATYLEPTALDEFHDYETFLLPVRPNPGDTGGEDQDVGIKADEGEGGKEQDEGDEDGDIETEEEDTESVGMGTLSDESPLSSHYSLFLPHDYIGTRDDHVNKHRLNTPPGVFTNTWPDQLTSRLFAGAHRT